MSRNDAAHDTAREARSASESTYAEERWQGASFAASWISPPHPRRYVDDATAPFRSDDHA